ncbi:MAG TPA: hypothetical protein VGZ29_17110 [Terriglobia bacterium]|nr:hypothetical protein [Terriglobia bacterium]
MWLDPRERIHAPEIEGQWVNSPPLKSADLRGRVVLVDFWDYTCVNCLRTLPYLREWHRRYATGRGEQSPPPGTRTEEQSPRLGRGGGKEVVEPGSAGILPATTPLSRHPSSTKRGESSPLLPADPNLVIIGVHAPEFSFARDPANVERALRAEGLDYPVVLDNNYRTWHAFANRCWPAKYLIDARGYIRYVHLGEGRYGKTEEAIQRLLVEAGVKAPLPAPLEPLHASDRPGAICFPVTPELYLGYARGRLGNESGYAADQVADYAPAGKRRPDVAYLEGPWFAGRELIAACPLDGRESRLRVVYTAAEVNMVLAPPDPANFPMAGLPGGEGATLVVCQDGRPLPPENRGADVLALDGETVIHVTGPRMYRLVRNPEFGPRELEIWTRRPGFEAYAFTFVACADSAADEAAS